MKLFSQVLDQFGFQNIFNSYSSLNDLFSKFYSDTKTNGLCIPPPTLSTCVPQPLESSRFDLITSEILYVIKIHIQQQHQSFHSKFLFASSYFRKFLHFILKIPPSSFCKAWHNFLFIILKIYIKHHYSVLNSLKFFGYKYNYNFIIASTYLLRSS